MTFIDKRLGSVTLGFSLPIRDNINTRGFCEQMDLRANVIFWTICLGILPQENQLTGANPINYFTNATSFMKTICLQKRKESIVVYEKFELKWNWNQRNN